MSASSSVATAAGTVVVVTHVIPAPQVAASQISTEKNKFSLRLVALGTVQIMIGLTVFLFELAMIPHADTLGIHTGAFVWGPPCYITSGSLAVAAATLLNNSLVNSSLVLNVTSAVASAAATIIYILDTISLHSNSLYVNNNLHQLFLLAVFAVLSFLEVLISFSATVFSCKASCHSTAQTVKPPEYNTVII